MSGQHRPYHSPIRAEHAHATRMAILDAATHLFGDRGYAATTIADIAQRAGVAPATVYSSVGTKTDLLAALNDRLDELAEVGPIYAKVQQAETAHEVIGLGVLITRQMNERTGDIIRAAASAAAAGGDLAAIYEEGKLRHRAGVERLVATLNRHATLRPDLTMQEASAIMGALTRWEMWSILTSDYGWSFDEAESWITKTLTELLLA